MEHVAELSELEGFLWAIAWPLFLLAVILGFVFFVGKFPLTYHRLFRLQPNPGLGVVRAAILLSGAWFALVLTVGAASDIEGIYVVFYVVLATACLLLASFAWPILGLYHVADVVERNNLAAGLVLGGFVLGTAFAFGGALTGEGPGWWVVLVFFALAYAELRASLSLVDRFGGRLAQAVRLDRDASAGLLLGCVAAAAGLVAGRAAAGDFLGWRDGLADYAVRLWPLPLVPMIGIGIGAASQAMPRRAAIRTATGLLLVAGGLAYYFLT